MRGLLGAVGVGLAALLLAGAPARAEDDPPAKGDRPGVKSL